MKKDRQTHNGHNPDLGRCFGRRERRVVQMRHCARLVQTWRPLCGSVQDHAYRFGESRPFAEVDRIIHVDGHDCLCNKALDEAIN